MIICIGIVYYKEMSEIQKCKNCNVVITWVYDGTKSRNRMWENKDWHICDPKSTTIIHPKKINWFCMGCNHVIDIANHPCIHYQKIGTGRAFVRMKAGEKKK